MNTYTQDSATICKSQRRLLLKNKLNQIEIIIKQLTHDDNIGEVYGVMLQHILG